MAWTPEKGKLLGELFRERLKVEDNINEWLRWDVSRSWSQILNTNVDDATKQLILNDFIDDKVHYLSIVQNEASATVTNLGIEIINLNGLKE